MKHISLAKKILLGCVLLPAFKTGFSQSLNPLLIGTIQPGDSIVISYDVTINNPCSCLQVANQGTVSGSNFAGINTDDPDTGVPGDSTVTPLNLFPLPVHLFDFRGLIVQEDVELHWKVNDEENMIKYEIERSPDGRTFFKIGEVNALNLSVAEYSFIDQHSNAGINFYRLRLIDNTSSLKYSAIIRFNIGNKKSSISIYPNPAVDQKFILALNNINKGTYELTVYNNMGQIVYEKSINTETGSMVREIILPASLARGIYRIRVTGSRQVFNHTLVLR